MNAGCPTPISRLQEVVVSAALTELSAETLARFSDYLGLLLRWNGKLNLTAIRDPEEILSRHFLESIACAQRLPAEIATLLDFGSGAGFPGVPIALCRPEIAVTLSESQGKKAAFLREACRVLGLSADVYAERAELLTRRFDCVTLRAVDRMEAATVAASRLVAEGGWLVVMTTDASFASVRAKIGEGFDWEPMAPLPSGDHRILALGRKG